jgi:hypothetical protein
MSFAITIERNLVKQRADSILLELTARRLNESYQALEQIRMDRLMD